MILCHLCVKERRNTEGIYLVEYLIQWSGLVEVVPVCEEHKNCGRTAPVPITIT